MTVAPVQEQEAAVSVEEALVSSGTLRVAAALEAANSVAPRDFEDPRQAKLWGALIECGSEISDPETGGADFVAFARVLERRGELLAVGGHPALARVMDIEASASLIGKYARDVKEDALKRERAAAARAFLDDPDDAQESARLRRAVTALEVFRAGVSAETVPGLTADDLIELAAGEEAASPLPGFFDPEPNLHILHGVAKTGKTTFAWLLALAWATGVAPWDGAPALPGTRVLVLSGEQSTRKCVRVLRRIARTTELADFEQWASNVTIVGRHADMTDLDRSLLELDEAGIDALRVELERARAAGEPYGLVVADSLSRLKPSGASTQDNDDMIAVLSPLAALASEYGVYILLIHHDGHSAERQGQAIDGVRGASAIRDVPQALWAVSRVKDQPRVRRIRVAGNELADLTQDFEVAESAEPEGFINRFRPSEAPALDLASVFQSGPLSLTEFGRRALDWAPEKAPSGAAKKRAAALLEGFRNQGLVRKERTMWCLAAD